MEVELQRGTELIQVLLLPHSAVSFLWGFMYEPCLLTLHTHRLSIVCMPLTVVGQLGLPGIFEGKVKRETNGEKGEFSFVLSGIVLGR